MSNLTNRWWENQWSGITNYECVEISTIKFLYQLRLVTHLLKWIAHFRGAKFLYINFNYLFFQVRNLLYTWIFFIRFFILDSTIAFNCVMEFHYIWNVAICFQYMVLMICCIVFHCRFVASENFAYVKVQINVRYTWDFFSKNGSFWNVSSLPWETTAVPHPKKGCNITNADLISIASAEILEALINQTNEVVWEHLSAEEKLAAKESFAVYCRPIELYNIIKSCAERYVLLLPM